MRGGLADDFHSAEFKAKVALEALRGLKTLNEIGQEYGVHPKMLKETLLAVSAVEKLPVYEGPMYRGESYLKPADATRADARMDELSSGPVRENGFLSTTRDPAIADRFAQCDSGTTARVFVPPSNAATRQGTDNSENLSA